MDGVQLGEKVRDQAGHREALEHAVVDIEWSPQDDRANITSVEDEAPSFGLGDYPLHLLIRKRRTSISMNGTKDHIQVNIPMKERGISEIAQYDGHHRDSSPKGEGDLRPGLMMTDRTERRGREVLARETSVQGD